jgi:hypothetical protein
MRTIRSVDVGSFAAYGALIAAFWTLVFGFIYWLLGWIFGATSWWIDMNLANLTVYSWISFIGIFARAFLAGLIGALGGLVVAVVYNFVANIMGGIKINLE